MATLFAAQFVLPPHEDIAKLEQMYSVDIFDGKAYIQYPNERSALTGVSRIERRFGIAANVVQVRTKYENIVEIVGE